ncbi:MAG: glucokinase, partial [Simkaniaceae bacterium]|nr:glucokinase [Simkaniaceae bacterium]
MFLAGDIGGTKTHLALYEKGLKQVREKKFPSKDYPNLTNIVSEFLEDEKIEKACFGIAGPVTNNTCHATNLPWDVEAKALSNILGGAPVTLINDLVANAY